jgi:hypothetical protein
MTRWTIVSAVAFLAFAAQGCSCSGDSGVDAGGMNEGGEISGEGQDDGAEGVEQDADATDGAERDGTTCTADADCDDGLFCTVDTCGGTGVCDHAALGCDDGIPCTTDSCDEYRVGAPLAGGASHGTGQVLFTSGSSGRQVAAPGAGRFTTSPVPAQA